MAVRDVSDVPLSDLLRLDGRAAVVTGAAKGIGAATAGRLAEAGANLVLGDLDEAAVGALAESLMERWPVKAVPVPLDVADSASVIAAADRAMAEFGRLDVWVNNAGVFPQGLALDMTDEQWDHVLDVNLRGTFVGAREAARRMVDAGQPGVVVNLASTAGFRAAAAGLPHYIASKHAVVGLTKSLAVELGPQGIRVLGVAPTLIETPGIRDLAAGADDAMKAMLHAFADRLPVRRVGVPDDVARVVLFCASDASALMTGSTLAVDGGDLAQ
jgi:NAD(P)-dependent dehydrogenase (short-subunit alcohol dehydrogenase family)